MAQAIPDSGTVNAADPEAVYRHARARVDKDRGKGVVPSDDCIESWLYLELRDRAVDDAIDAAVTRLIGEQRIYIAGNAASTQAIVHSHGLHTRHEYNARKDEAYCLGYDDGYEEDR
jgi:hypothetical protein